MSAPAAYDGLRLPERACLLHIGPYKTGSSAIQDALHFARAALREHGVVYPGTTSRARRPGWAVIGHTPPGNRPATIDEWHDLVREVRDASDMRACVSTEDFGRVDGALAGRIVTDLGPDRVHVVTVVRRLDRLLPSQWQQRVQSLMVQGYEEYLRIVLDPDSYGEHRVHRSFWASHDVGRQLERWRAVVGADRVIALVADDTDRDHLPRTFEALLGLPAGVLTARGGGGVVNPSLSANGIELHRRLNIAAEDEGWPVDLYARLARGMARGIAAAGRGERDVSVPRLPSWAAERVTELSGARADAVASSGVRVVGDPESLRTVEATEGSGDVSTISLEAAVHGLAGAVEAFEQLRVAAERRRADSQRRAESRPAPSVAQTPGADLVDEIRRRVAGRTRRALDGGARRLARGR